MKAHSKKHFENENMFLEKWKVNTYITHRWLRKYCTNTGDWSKVCLQHSPTQPVQQYWRYLLWTKDIWHLPFQFPVRSQLDPEKERICVGLKFIYFEKATKIWRNLPKKLSGRLSLNKKFLASVFLNCLATLFWCLSSTTTGNVINLVHTRKGRLSFSCTSFPIL